MSLLMRLYQGLVRLYPPGYRLEMGDEMYAAYQDAVDEASQAGKGAVVRVALREVRDAPGNLFWAYWRSLRSPNKEFMMSTLFESNGVGTQGVPSLSNDRVPGSWRDALLAGLPHGILTLLLMIFTLVSPVQPGVGPVNVLEMFTLVTGWSLGLVLVVLFFVAWRRGWPRWAASTYLYAFLGAVMPVLWGLQTLDTELAYRWMDILMSLVFLLALILWILVVVRRDAVKGLLMLVPIAILSWWPVLEFIPNQIRNPLQAGMFLITTLVAVWITRNGSWRRGIWVLLAASLVVGLPISYFRIFHHQIPPEYASPANLAAFSDQYAGAAFWSALLVIGPLLIWTLRELGFRSGGNGRVGYRLSVLGLVFNLVVNLTVDRTYSYGWLRYNPGWEALSGILILGSAFVFLAGVILVLWSARTASLVSRLTGLILGSAALGLPLMLMLPMFDRRYAPTGLPFGLTFENQVTDFWVYGLGVLWLLIGGSLITRLRVPYVKYSQNLET